MPMVAIEEQHIAEEYLDFLGASSFPCIAAKAAMAREHIRCMVAGHLACPADDRQIISFLYDFVDRYRASDASYHSAVVVFKEPLTTTEESFETFFWQRLQSIARLDASNYPHDPRVSNDPSSPDFSFSIKMEGFYIIGLHPASSRMARRFRYPAIVFNPHAEFEKLRRHNRYQQMKKTVRKRDMKFSGSINPMLNDFGELSEVFQYSGKRYNDQWQCPLNIGRNDTASPSVK